MGVVRASARVLVGQAHVPHFLVIVLDSYSVQYEIHLINIEYDPCLTPTLLSSYDFSCNGEFIDFIRW